LRNVPAVACERRARARDAQTNCRTHARGRMQIVEAEQWGIGVRWCRLQIVWHPRNLV